MAINYTFENEAKLLKVKASGKDDTVEQVIEYGMAVLNAAISLECIKVLCDETELQYSIGTFDTYESARIISQNAPNIAQVAIVCNPLQIEDADFWSTVASNRGLHVRVFKTIDEANSWLGI